MKKIKNVIIIIVILMSVGNESLAHGGNITGWKYKDSENITEYNGKYYVYHKEDGVVHYHQVKWDEENQIIENNNTDIQDNNLVYMILGIAIILIISIFSIAHNKKKEK